MSRRALITGVSGFAGKHLAEQLMTAGWEVGGTVRHRSSGLAGVAEYPLEIDDYAAVRAAVAEFGPTHVFHLAAIVDTVATPDIMALYRANVLGTVAVLEAVRLEAGIERVLVASSAFVYGGGAPGGRALRESDELLPLTPYGSSKVGSEAIALQWSRNTGVDVVVTRAFQHTGPGHVGAYALSDWASQLASGARKILVGNLAVSRDYLDVRDVVDAYVALMERGHPGEIYNVASGSPVTMRTLLEGLVSAFGGQAEIVVDPARMRGVDQTMFYADVDLLRTHTGWVPKYSLDETLADLARWWRSRLVRRAGPAREAPR